MQQPLQCSGNSCEAMCHLAHHDRSMAQRKPVATAAQGEFPPGKKEMDIEDLSFESIDRQRFDRSPIVQENYEVPSLDRRVFSTRRPIGDMIEYSGIRRGLHTKCKAQSIHL